MSGPEKVEALVSALWIVAMVLCAISLRLTMHYERAARRYHESGEKSWNKAEAAWNEAIEDVARRERELEKRLYGEGWKP